MKLQEGTPAIGFDFVDREGGKPREEALREICSTLHGGDWDKFTMELVKLLTRRAKDSGSPGSLMIKRRTIERDLAWIYAAREAGTL